MNYRKPIHTDTFLAYSSNHPISANFSVIHTLIHRAEQVCATPEFLSKEMDHLHKVPQDNHDPAQIFQQDKPQLKTNRKPNPSTEHFTEGTIVIIPYIKSLREQNRHNLAKYKVTVLFKGNNIIKSCIQKIQFQMLRKLTYSSNGNAQSTTAQLNT